MVVIWAGGFSGESPPEISRPNAMPQLCRLNSLGFVLKLVLNLSFPPSPDRILSAFKSTTWFSVPSYLLSSSPFGVVIMAYKRPVWPTPRYWETRKLDGRRRRSMCDNTDTRSTISRLSHTKSNAYIDPLR